MTLAQLRLRIRRALAETVNPLETAMLTSQARAIYSPSTTFLDDDINRAIIDAQSLLQSVCVAMVQPRAVRSIGVTEQLLPANVIRVLESRIERNNVRCTRRVEAQPLLRSGRPYSITSPVYELGGGYLRVYPAGGVVTAYVVVSQTLAEASEVGAELMLGPQVREALVQLASARLRHSASMAMMGDMNASVAMEEVSPYLLGGVQTRFYEQEVRVEQYQ